MESLNEVLLRNGEGPSIWVLGDLYTLKLTGKQTNGACCIIDQQISAGSGPPPHIHHREDEAFYVLEGSFTFLCGESQAVYEKGSFIYVPKGKVHTFKNTGTGTGRLLVTITPAGLEDFFYAIGTPAAEQGPPPPPQAPDIAKLMLLAKKFYMDIVLP